MYVLKALIWFMMRLGVFGLCMLLLGCEGTSTLETIKKKRFIRVGVFDNVPPLAYYNQNDELDGLEIRLARKIAKDLLGDEKRLELVVISAKDSLSMPLESGEVDVMIASLIGSQEMRKHIDFASSYIGTPLSVLSHTNQTSSILEFLDATLLVRKNTIAAKYIQENYPQIQIRLCENLAYCFEEFQADKNLYFVELRIIAQAFMRQNPDIHMSIPVLGDEYSLAPAVKKGNTKLLQWLNKEIITLQQEGFFAQNYEALFLP